MKRVILYSVIVFAFGCAREQAPPSTSSAPEEQPTLGRVLSSVPKDEELVKPEYSKILAASLRKLTIANPVADLDDNLRRGNSRFVGIYGYSCSPPGLDQSGMGNALTPDQLLLMSKGVDCIDGTGDVIPDDRQYRDLYETAWHCAEVYNKELLRRIRIAIVN